MKRWGRESRLTLLFSGDDSMTRREFSKALMAAGSAVPLVKGDLSASRPAEAARSDPAYPQTRDDGFPAGSYTPFGYLDNPYHSWALHPSGVLRSVPPLGLGLYYPAGPGGYFDYGKNSIYRSLLRVGFRIGGKVYYEESDFTNRGFELTALHHSKNILALDLRVPPLKISAAFFQLDEHILVCTLSLSHDSASSVEATVFGVQRLELGASEWWGRDGIAGLYDKAHDCVLLRSFASGPAFALTADIPSVARLVTAEEAILQTWMSGSAVDETAATTYYPDPLQAGMAWMLRIPAGQTTWCHISLGRAENESSAAMAAHTAQLRASTIYAGKKSEDDRFWSEAPRLEGDFPEHWKNSWVYDFETLRTMVRRPRGVYKHRWDAMQIQAPRNVLAETSIDMWTLAYADSDTAKAVLLGQFQDALAPNVPCMREDGTMNMVAADGSECGTSLQWCYPFYCIESVFLRTMDRAWLAELYPLLAAHLNWTLKHRTDRDGWIVAKCSWETGMDASSRFLLKQPTGGELIDFVRVAELQAAMSHAARTLELYARLVSKPADSGRWSEVASNYAAKTRQLWYHDWFYDVDARSGKPIVIPGHREVTQVGPVMCGVATQEQVRAMLPAMREYESDQKFWLEWPPHVLPYAESLWVAGERELLSRVLYQIVDRVYSSMDRRQVQPNQKLGWPGVSCELWSLEGARGGECYGWGATLPAHIIRNVFGFREAKDPGRLWFTVSPGIPEALFGEGKSFGLRNVHYRQRTFDLHYRCREGRKLEVSLSFSSPSTPREISVSDESGRQIPVRASGHQWTFDAGNYSIYRVRWTA
jgi:mannosylglycerate hydrolase MGH1-like protein